MKKIVFTLLGILILLSSCKEDANSNKEITASSSDTTLYYGGDIITMEGEEAQYAEADYSQDQGEISFVGSLEEAEKQFPNRDSNN